MAQKNKHFYVYHLEEFNDMDVPIFEPFEFNEFAKAKSHSDFFHALCGLDYHICTNLQLIEIINEDKIPCF